MAEITIKAIKEFFGMRPGDTLKSFTEEWKSLSDEDKAQIKQGLSDGTFTY